MIKLTRKNFIKTGLFGGIFAGLINQKKIQNLCQENLN